MFTGIITDIGTITSVEARGDLRVTVATAYDTGGIAIGASIACSGACLTVVGKGADWFAVDISGESVACTASGLWTEGRRLNLERALKIGDELGGHIVTGHVDGVGTIAEVVLAGDSHVLRIDVPAEIAPYIAAKGSVTVDGISLTVNEVDDIAGGCARFALNIIPHTWACTTLADAVNGRQVNIEIDVLARYLARMRDRGM